MTVGETKEVIQIDAGYLPNSNSDKATLKENQPVSKSLPDHNLQSARLYMTALYEGNPNGGFPLKGLSVKERYTLLADLGSFCAAMKDVVSQNHIIQDFGFTFQDSGSNNKKFVLPDRSVGDNIFRKSRATSPLRRVVTQLYLYFGDRRTVEDATEPNVEFLRELAAYGMFTINCDPDQVANRKERLLEDTPWFFFLDEKPSKGKAKDK